MIPVIHTNVDTLLCIKRFLPHPQKTFYARINACAKSSVQHETI